MTKAYYYLVTIKGHEYRHYPQDELDMKWQQLRKKLGKAEWSDCRAYEVDSRFRMHLHVYCKVYKKPFFQRFQCEGWSIHFQEFPPEDINRVYDYFQKWNQQKYAVRQRFDVNAIQCVNVFLEAEPVHPGQRALPDKEPVGD